MTFCRQIVHTNNWYNNIHKLCCENRVVQTAHIVVSCSCIGHLSIPLHVGIIFFFFLITRWNKYWVRVLSSLRTKSNRNCVCHSYVESKNKCLYASRIVRSDGWHKQICDCAFFCFTLLHGDPLRYFWANVMFVIS